MSFALLSQRSALRRSSQSSVHVYQSSLRQSTTSSSTTASLSSTKQQQRRHDRPHSTAVPLTAGGQSYRLATASANTATQQQLCPHQLRNLFIASSVPMMGFGFMDNLVLLLAGSYIDVTVGATLGLATLTAAAAGQVVSDVSGVLCGGTLERLTAGWIPMVQLTAAQRKLPLARNTALAGAVGGVIVGCLAGAVVGLGCIGVYEEEDTGGMENAVGIVEGLLGDRSSTLLYVAPGVLDISSAVVQSMPAAAASGDTSILQQCFDQQQLQKDGHSLYIPVVGKEGKCWGVMSMDGTTGEDGNEGELLSKTIAVVFDKLLA